MLHKLIMYGGAKDTLKKGKFDLNLFIVLVVFFLLRALAVQYTYNSVAPKLIGNWGHDKSEFRPLNFNEALMFSLLISFLFI